MCDINVDLEAGKWGTNPQQNADEVNSLTCCCCDCCHRSWLQSLSPDCLCGVFLRHSMANQFFTPHTIAKATTHTWRLRPLNSWAQYKMWRWQDRLTTLMAHNHKHKPRRPFSFCQQNTYKCCEICMVAELLGIRVETVLWTCAEAHAT